MSETADRDSPRYYEVKDHENCPFRKMWGTSSFYFCSIEGLKGIKMDCISIHNFPEYCPLKTKNEI